VELREGAHEGEAEAEPAAAVRERGVALGEGLEHRVDARRVHADAGVPDAHRRGPVRRRLRRHRDGAAPLRELPRVLEEVVDHLREARGIAVHPERPVGQRALQAEPGRGEERAVVLEERAEHRAQVEALAADPDLAPGDPRDVEEVVHEPGEVRQTPRPRAASAAAAWAWPSAAASCA